ncbi:MAG: phytanoyl-CoA hydroxylase [Chloroflexota bacterium]|nr:phytanoyl-CoA hydroxylase [Chloroflexota bacterium]
MLTPEMQADFQRDGYLIARGLFKTEEAASYRDHYMRLNDERRAPGDTRFTGANPNDPLVKYPRMLQMHRWDETSLNWLLDRRIGAALTDLLGAEPFAVQTMIYFKPPGARGQALHQDNYYLRAQPGTCIAAWMALDEIDEANGCLNVVPGSQAWPLLCTTQANTQESFTDITVPIPEGTPVAPARMQPGDVLFFNGQLVHGSFANRTADRFRRSLIGHYIQGDAQQVAKHYQPALRFDGSEVTVDVSSQGSQCGVWVTEGGKPVIEVVGYEKVQKATE